jgi:hypothetical protein
MMSRARVWEEMRSTEAEGRRVTAAAAPTMSGGEEVNRERWHVDPIEVTTKIADVAPRMRKAPKNPPRG